MKPIRVRITECHLESGKDGVEAYVSVQLLQDGDVFSLPIDVADAKGVLQGWKDPGPLAELTLTLRKKKR